MTPTNELRFVEREYSEPYQDPWNIRLDGVGNVVTAKVWTVRILQQKWVDDYTYPDERTRYYKEEWRDVPVTKEGA